METVVTWGAVSTAVAAVVFACHASYRVGRMNGVQNGMSATLKRIEDNIGKLFGKVDGLRCGEHEVRMEEYGRRINVLEERR